VTLKRTSELIQKAYKEFTGKDKSIIETKLKEIERIYSEEKKI
jgi:hypothetical protein